MANEIFCTRTYEIAGVRFSLTAPEYPEDPRLSPFAVRDGADKPPDVTYVITPAAHLDRPEPASPGTRLLFEDPLMTLWRREDGSDLLCRRDEHTGDVYMIDSVTEQKDAEPSAAGAAPRFTHEISLLASYLPLLSLVSVKLLDLPGQMIRMGGVFLHASFIEVGGEAILFTAHKQVGKSTQAVLWERHRGAQVVNGDRAVLRRSPDGRWFAYGSPYSGTSGICRVGGYPIRAIVLLSQGKTCTAARAGVRQSFIALMDGCSFDTYDPAEVDAVTSLCAALIPAVTFCTLSCTPDERAILALEEVL